MSVQITVTDKVAPTGTKKQWKFTDGTGKNWYAYSDIANQLQVGGTYDITDSQSSNFNGRTYYTIKAISQVSAPTQQSIGQAQQASAVMDDQRRKDIFMCGGFNSIMSNPAVNPLALTASEKLNILRELADIWRNAFSKTNQQMNDENPFV